MIYPIPFLGLIRTKHLNSQFGPTCTVQPVGERIAFSTSSVIRTATHQLTVKITYFICQMGNKTSGPGPDSGLNSAINYHLSIPR